MSTLKIKEALAAKGISVTEVETVKNGIVCSGYQIDNGSNVKPVVYYSTDETIETFVEKVLKIAERPAPEVDIDRLVCRESMLNDSYLCLQKQGSEAIIKKPYLNMELYVRLAIDLAGSESKASAKITKQMLDKAGVSEEELFEYAYRNSLFKACICSMSEALGLTEEIFEDVPFAVGTYDDRCHGAAVMALPECLHSYCAEKGYGKMFILPSSTEEVLLLPDTSGDPEMLAEMVNDVNKTEVDPVMQFDPVVYIYDDATQEISIAASFVERGC